ncbi:fumarate reductase flavoprotein subunit [Actinomycetospora succinea]|uniref:Fumarate reductase flavoprotein subunit n=1 Tax=Actinomycetospora succinea TaxID=663603 RepID=A0A4R6VDT9_9PSEU|nr:FAD-binding protein [Actinomycetospora succinea]TDQ60511.1 fumarate reductase flavoprotein subunit [Actinomycetospora succinea]
MVDTDLVVVGAGGGLAGALRAAEHGLDVVVVEADEHFRRGNNTAMSTAMVPGAGSRFQRAAGIDDSPELFLADVEAKTAGAADRRVARALTTVSASLVEWLADGVGLPIELPVDMDYPGHSARRVHTVPGRHGSSLLRGLADAVAASDRIDLLCPSRAVDVQLRDGAVVTVSDPSGATEVITARAVLLATNGFGADASLVAEHVGEIAGATYHGSEYARGDALRLGTALGAATGCLDAYQGHAALSAAARTLVTWTTVMHGAVVVDADGRRFADETAGYSEFAAWLAARPGARGWVVLDQRIDALSRAFGDYRDVVDSGALRWAGNVADLAGLLGVPTSVLAGELADAAAVARGEQDADRVGRTSVEAPLAAPLAAVEIVPALFHTQGGLRVDEHARVLDADERPLGPVYASGGAAVGMSGHGAAGYLAGNGLLPALGLAHLAADHLAATPRLQEVSP